MTTNNNHATWALVVLIGLVLLLAFRSIFFVLPFGFFPGISHVFRDAGHSLGGVFGFIPFVFMPLALMALWVFVIIWVYRDAESRGMSGILWALLVLIGNVVGLLIYLIMRHETPVRRAEPGPAPAAAACAGCGKPVAAGYAFCPCCGRPSKAVCPSCKKPVEAGWKVCPYCGTSLDPGKTEQA
jgi:RNA polymerase subunit RPABC4/transcription elongation factor Spt4